MIELTSLFFRVPTSVIDELKTKHKSSFLSTLLYNEYKIVSTIEWRDLRGTVCHVTLISKEEAMLFILKSGFEVI